MDDEAVLQALDPADLVSLTAGADTWHTVALERPSIPALRMSDGPNGVRGPRYGDGPPSAAFPVATALAATWDVELVAEIGTALAAEAIERDVQVLLAPTLNLHRHPLAGRNFECFSEDPLLAARLAVAYIGALQEAGVAACAKHLVANDSEWQRHRVSSEVSERALRELYLVPFEAAVRDAGVWSVMTGYNRLNGAHCAAHEWLLGEVLKGEWGFDGLVMSDWFGTDDTLAMARAGLDLEMPGPARHFGPRLLPFLDDGNLPIGMVADKVRRLLRLVGRTATPAPPAPIDRWALARRAAARSMVVLKNDGLLPLDASKTEPPKTEPPKTEPPKTETETDLPPDERSAPAAAPRRVAIIGPNAHPGQIMGGGSSQVRPLRHSSPLDALRERFGAGVEITYEPGCRTHRLCPSVGRLSFTVTTRLGDTAAEETEVQNLVERLGDESAFPAAPQFSQRYRADYVAERDGPHVFGVTAVGAARVRVDEVLVADNWTEPRRGHTFFGAGSREVRGTVDLVAGRPVAVEVDYRYDGVRRGPFPGLRLGIEAPEEHDLLERAAGAARGADLVIAVVGSNDEWESEGFDRDRFTLPGRQDQLLDAVLSVNRSVVVVLNTGSPVAMGWVDRASAVVQAWYPGMAFGEALADVLFGDVNPSGRLPTTFPRRLEDHPAYLNYPPEGGRLLYGEGIFAGYRGFDARDSDPMFAFGHGLSYTTFAYGPLHAEVRGSSAPGGGADRSVWAELDVTNTGERAGAEVVQLYVGSEGAPVPRPPKELKGFSRVELQPGETRRVRFELDERAFAHWDPDHRGWRVQPGRFDLLVGSSSRDIRVSAAVFW